MIVKEKNNPKIFKIFKIFKKEKNQNQNQNQRLWYSLRSCRFKSKSKVKSIDNVFAALILLKSKSFKVRTLPGCSVLTIENQKGACNQGKNWRNFYSVQSLVDTRLVNSIRAFVYAFIVELMHQRAQTLRFAAPKNNDRTSSLCSSFLDVRIPCTLRAGRP